MPELAINAAGYAVCVWQQYDIVNEKTALRSAELQFGNVAWVNNISLTSPGDDLDQQKVAVDPSGTAFAVWHNKATTAVQAATLAVNGVAWSLVTNLTGLNLAPPNPHVAVGLSGFAAASWTFQSGGIYSVQASIYNGGWGLPQTISGNLTIATTSSIAVDGNNNVSVVWNSLIPFASLIESSYRPSSMGVWGSPVIVSSSTDHGLAFAEVAFGANQNTYATWASLETPSFPLDTAHIEFASAIAGGAWTSPPCDDFSPNGSIYSHLAVALNGFGAIVWQYTIQPLIQASSFPVSVATVVSVTPNSGSSDGGNTVLITGTGFLQVSEVAFGLGNPSPDFTVVSPTLIVAVVPPGVGVVDVRVINSGGTSAITPGDQYTFTAPICYQR